MIREQASFSILTSFALFAVSAPPLPIVFFSFSLFFSFNSFLTLPSPGMGWCIQEQSRPYRRGPNLWGVKEERHWIPHVRPRDPVAYTHTAAGRRQHTKQLKCVQMCVFRSNLSHSVMYIISFSVAFRWHLLRRATPSYKSTAPLLSPHHKSSHQPTPPLRSPTFMPLDLSILHLTRYNVTPINTPETEQLVQICTHPVATCSSFDKTTDFYIFRFLL